MTFRTSGRDRGRAPAAWFARGRRWTPCALLALATAACGAPGAPVVDAQPSLDAALGLDGADARAERAPIEEPLDSSRDVSGQPDAPDAVRPVRVLFIGNSYTYVNDLPGTIRALGAATPGHPIEVDSVTEGGAGLGDHWYRTGARDRIASGHWDLVVLQDQSVAPLTLSWLFAINARDFANVVRAAGARTVWYATWARRAGDPIYLPGHAPSGGTITPDEMTRQLDYVYQAAADANGGVVARAGRAWQLAQTELPTVNLYADDGSHPSPEGTLLTACVMFQSITGEAPRMPDATPLGLPSDRARAVCGLAPRVYRDTDRVDGAIPACGTSPLMSLCGSTCVDLTRDDRNCGACGAVCAAPRTCYPGVCACPAAYSFDASYAALSALEPRCDGVEQRSGASCNAAIHRLCVARGCGNTGFGAASDTGAGVSATCLTGDLYDTTYRSLQRWDASCDGVTDRDGPRCARAIQGYCVSKGDVGGFGPVAVAGDTVGVACVPPASAVRESVPPIVLASAYPGCDLTVDPWSPACRRASESLCRGRGHAGGFGPVTLTSDGTLVEITCTLP